MEMVNALVLAIVLMIALWIPYYVFYSSRKSTRPHLVHVVEAARPLRHRSRRWGSPADSTGRRRCAGREVLEERTSDDEGSEICSLPPDQPDERRGHELERCADEVRGWIAPDVRRLAEDRLCDHTAARSHQRIERQSSRALL